MRGKINSFQDILSNFSGKKILVIGDVLLDQYILGQVAKISSEAPVPVVLQEQAFYTLGGAANVANNLQSLGAKVSLVGKIGEDPEGKILLRDLKTRQINTDGMMLDKRIPTSVKTRIIAQQQQIVRLDRERIEDFGNDTLNQVMIDFIAKKIDSFHAIIISDYGKGVINPILLSNVCSLALEKKKILTVDPKVEHFANYSGVTAITPNRKETENAIRNIKIKQNAGNRLRINVDQLKTDSDINLAGESLLKFLHLESLLITLGEQGMRLFEKGKKPVHINTRAQEVFDVTGAGDTVIAVFTLCLTSGATQLQAAEIANHAAGIVVGKMGAVTVSKSELLVALSLTQR